MSTKAKKEIVVLAVVMGLLSFSIYSQIGGNASRAYTASVQKQPPRSTSSRQTTEVLQVELLDHSVPHLSGLKRNIFQFGARSDAEEPPAPIIHIPQSQPAMPMPPAIPEVHYLGFYLEKDTGLMLASIVNGGKIYVGKVGQILGGKYEILEIASDHVILRLMDDGKVLRVPLGRGPANVVNWAAMTPGGEDQ